MESFECSGHIKSKWAFPRTTCIGILDIMCQRGWVQPESPIGLASFLGETIHGVCAEYRACFGLRQAVKSKWHRASDQGDHARIQKFKAIKQKSGVSLRPAGPRT